MRYSSFSKWWERARKEASTHLSNGYQFVFVFKGAGFGVIHLRNKERHSRLACRVWDDGYSIYEDGEWVAYKNEQGSAKIGKKSMKVSASTAGITNSNDKDDGLPF